MESVILTLEHKIKELEEMKEKTPAQWRKDQIEQEILEHKSVLMFKGFYSHQLNEFYWISATEQVENINNIKKALWNTK